MDIRYALGMCKAVNLMILHTEEFYSELKLIGTHLFNYSKYYIL